MSELLSIGASHRTAPIELRERLALTGGREVALLGELSASESIAEAAAVSTCNRIEIYVVARDPVEAEGVVLGALARQAAIGATELAGNLRTWRGADAARHLLRVAAGLDSMILGEAEIQGQLKRAYERSLAEGTSGAILNRLFRDALAAGKRVRAETKLGEGAVSVASAAVELARRVVGELPGRRVLLVGAGDTAELTAAALSARGVETVIVANRRFDRAVSLADRYEGKARRLEELPTELALADVVISSTNSPHHIVGRVELEPVLEERRARGRGTDSPPLLMVDLAVPRDVDPECAGIEGVVVRDVDDVQSVADAGLAAREAAVDPAEAIVAAELERFELWLSTLRAVPTIAALRSRGEEVADRVIDENRSFLHSLEPEDRERAEAMLHSLLSRFLHDPTLRLRREAEAGGHEDYELQRRLAAIRELFGLDPDVEPPHESGEVEVTDLDAYRRSRSRPAGEEG